MVKELSQFPPPPKGLPRDTRHKTANALHSAAVRLLRRAAAVDSGMDLDGPRASLLSVLVFGGPQTMSQLAKAERVTPAAITKLVTALEELGLAERVRDGGDRRVVSVMATGEGREVLEKGRADRVGVIAGVLKGLSTEDLAMLRRAAEIVADALTRAGKVP